jgi:hypothetical protein
MNRDAGTADACLGQDKKMAAAFGTDPPVEARIQIQEAMT